MKVSIIVAAAQNRVIGRHNQLIWHLPADLQHFKRLTMGHPILMGRKTFESIGRPLPGRTSIIISRNSDYRRADCVVVHSLEQAIQEAQQRGSSEAFIIGGAQIYEQSLPLADAIYLTRVKASFEGDAFFPLLSENEWREVAKESFEPDEKNPHPYEFIELERVRRP